MLTLVVARARNGAIGKGGDIPWYAPEDLAHFQRETMGGAVIMGRKTWESLPFKPLKSRLNIVVTSAVGVHDCQATSVEQAIGIAKDAGYHRIYGIGGAAIYAALLPMADRLMVTEVDIEIADADAYFPDFDTAEWGESARTVLRKAAPRCVGFEWLRA